ncbi:MAG: MarR family winged helix-turn-helix transcriptional regulator [Lacrimispora sp.]
MNEIKQKYVDQLDCLMHEILKHYKDYQTCMCALYPQGITSTELSVIKIVHLKPDIVIKEVSEHLSIPGSTLTSVIDRLEQKKLIIRTVSKRNRHSFGMELTEEGIKLNAEHENAERQIWCKVLSLLDSDHDREMLIQLLTTMVNKLDWTDMSDTEKIKEKKT